MDTSKAVSDIEARAWCPNRPSTDVYYVGSFLPWTFWLAQHSTHACHLLCPKLVVAGGHLADPQNASYRPTNFRAAGCYRQASFSSGIWSCTKATCFNVCSQGGVAASSRGVIMKSRALLIVVAVALWITSSSAQGEIWLGCWHCLYPCTEGCWQLHSAVYQGLGSCFGQCQSKETL